MRVGVGLALNFWSEFFLTQKKQTWNSSKTFREQEFWVGNPSTKTAYVRTIKYDEKRVDPSTIFGSIYNMQINPQSAD